MPHSGVVAVEVPWNPNEREFAHSAGLIHNALIANLAIVQTLP